MKAVTAGEILAIAEYEPMRDRFRSRIIALKAVRRVGVGDRVSIVFENHDTVLWQIQEMVRAERITDPTAIQFEVDTYNDLLPGAGELAATLLIEITDRDRIRAELDALIGLDEHVTLAIGSHHTPARFQPGRSTADRIAAVQFIRFALPPGARAALADPSVPASLAIDHPSYRESALLSAETRASLLADLA